MPAQTLSCTILSGASLSDVAQPAYAPAASLGHMLVYGIVMPDTWTAANLTFQISADGTNYTNVYDANGAEVTINADASRFILIPPALCLSGGFIKVRSGSAAAAINQGGDRVIKLLARSFE